MPDLRPLRQAEMQIAATETWATAAMRTAYEALRVRLADVLLGGSSAMLSLQVRAAFGVARSQIRAIATGTATAVDAQAAAFAGDEHDLLAQLLGFAPGAVLSAAQRRAILRDALIDESLTWLSTIEGQLIAGAVQMQLSQADPVLVQQRLIADTTPVDGRVSIWRSGLAPLEAAIVGMVWGGWNGGRQLIYQEAEAQSPIRYRRQAIAAIDKRTTFCCLRVHGQIVDIDRPFVLTGTPRYGSELMWPPFHWRCRTSIVLYHEAMESIGISTPAMIAQARREQATRGGA